MILRFILSSGQAFGQVQFMIYTRGPASSNSTAYIFSHHMRHISEAFLDHSFFYSTSKYFFLGTGPLVRENFTYGCLMGLDFLLIVFPTIARPELPCFACSSRAWRWRYSLEVSCLLAV